jgi:hypothetical protein
MTPEEYKRRMRLRRMNLLMGYAALAAGKTQQTPEAPVNTAAPFIEGTPTVGSTLTANVGGWTGYPSLTYTYQWNRDGTPIGGETGSTYVVDAADVGEDITVTVTATNSEGSASETSAAVVGEAAPSGGDPAYLLETGDTFLLESGDRMLLEAA